MLVSSTQKKKEQKNIADKLLNIHKNDMLQLNNNVFDQPYAHLDYDTFNNNIYKNLNKLIIDKK